MLPDIHNRIVNAKYVLEKAASIQAEKSEMSLAISLLLMHDAIELLMIAILDHAGANSNSKRNFMDFWPEMKKVTAQEPSDRIPMEALNKLRVGLKHNGNLPNPQTVRELLPRTKGFFENILSAYCNLSYEDISLLDRISDAEVKSRIREAIAEFRSGSRSKAMESLSIALYKIEHPEGKFIPFLEAPRAPTIPQLGSEMADTQRRLTDYAKSLHRFLGASADRINALTYSFDPIRYAGFVKHLPAAVAMRDGSFQIQHWRDYDDIEEELFVEMVSFLVDYGLRLEEASFPIVRNHLSLSAS